MLQLVETESQVNANLDEQRCALIDQANYDFNLRQARSERAKFDDFFRQQDAELVTKSRDCEKSRYEQFLLMTELQSREKAHQETPSCARDGVEELRKT